MTYDALFVVPDYVLQHELDARVGVVAERNFPTGLESYPIDMLWRESVRRWLEQASKSKR